MDICIVSFTASGAETAEKVSDIFVKNHFLTETYSKYPKYNQKQLDSNIHDFIKDIFRNIRCIVFVGAVGIAVRAVSRYIVSKDKDPAVIVIDEQGRYVIPLLSGHLGGANKMALELSEYLNAEAVITTASDTRGSFSVDTWASENGCFISNVENIKYITAAVLNDESIGLLSDYPIEGGLPRSVHCGARFEKGIYISEHIDKKPYPITLNIVPQTYVLGIGCKKNTGFDKLKETITNVLELYKINIHTVRVVASIDIKSNEDALLRLSKELHIPFCTYSAEELNVLDGNFTSSEFVNSITGVDNVCERAALKVFGGEIVIKKTSCNGITLALVKYDWVCRF